MLENEQQTSRKRNANKRKKRGKKGKSICVIRIQSAGIGVAVGDLSCCLQRMFSPVKLPTLTLAFTMKLPLLNGSPDSEEELDGSDVTAHRVRGDSRT